MKTFWLYYGDLLVDTVRCENKWQAGAKALSNHLDHPGMHHLSGTRTPAEIRNLILHSEVRE